MYVLCQFNTILLSVLAVSGIYVATHNVPNHIPGIYVATHNVPNHIPGIYVATHNEPLQILAKMYVITHNGVDLCNYP